MLLFENSHFIFFGLGISFFWITFFLIFLQKEKKRVLSYQKMASEALEKQKFTEEKLSFHQEHTKEKIALLEETRLKMKETLEALSLSALRQNSSTFLELAEVHLQKWQEGAKSDLHLREKSFEKLILPISETLGKFDQKITELEKARITAYTGLENQVTFLHKTQQELKEETTKLVQALKAPQIRGRWGEIQLRRVLEIAGMVKHCDFSEQKNLSGNDNSLRPDVIVFLPNQRKIIIDAKTPLQSFLEAMEATTDRERLQKRKEHAKHLKNHITDLSSKAYGQKLSFHPEFVILFIPADPFFQTALEEDPSLLEYGVEKKVILSTPSTLIALLLTIAHGWTEQAVTENAKEIWKLGKTLFERLKIFNDHFSEIKRGLDKTIEAYNKTVRSMETRVVVAAQKFQEFGIEQDKEIQIPDPIDMTPIEAMKTE